MILANWFFNQLMMGVVLAEEGGGTEVEEANPVVEVVETTSNSEENAEEESGEIVTGDSVAIANSVNEVNIDLDESSSLEVEIVNKVGGEKEDIDVSQSSPTIVPSPSPEASESGELEENEGGVLINTGDLESETVAVAVSGGNEIGGDGSIESGDSVAIANSVNVLNASLEESEVRVSIVNADASLTGDLILPNPDKYKKSNNSSGGGGTLIMNEAEVESGVVASAVSGENEMGGEGSIVSGDSVAAANSTQLVNVSLLNTDWYWVEVNILGNYSGSIINWGEPGSTQKIENGKLVFYLGGGGESGQGESGALIQEAEVKTGVRAEAISGENKMGGDGTIKSGDSMAMANLINIINSYFKGSKLFLGINNIGGDWGGNIVFAYPDLEIGVTANKGEIGREEEVEFIVSYRNSGQDPVENYRLELGLDNNLEVLGTDPLLREEGGKWVYEGGYLGSGEGGLIKIRGRYKDVVSKSFVKEAWAAEWEDSLTVEGSIGTGVRESRTSNNRSSTSIRVVWEDGIGGDPGNGGEEELPVLELGAKNNVVDGIYVGDIVSFEIDIENKSGRKAYEGVLIHQIVNEDNEVVDESVIGLGDIEANKKGKVDFGVYSGFTQEGAYYYTRSWVEARSEKGVEVRSNESGTDFRVKYRGGRNVLGVSDDRNGGIGKVLAREGGEEVLGVCESRDEDILVYILLFVISFFWIKNQSGKWIKEVKGEKDK